MSSEHENSGDMSHPHVDPTSWVKKEDDAPSEHQHSGDMSHPHIDPTSSLKNEDDAPSKHAHSGDMSHPHIDRDVAFGIIRFVDDVRAFVVGYVFFVMLPVFFSYAPGWWVPGFMLVVFSDMRKCLVFVVFHFSMCLVLCRPCFFLFGPPDPPQSISIVFMITLCMENVIGRICKLCTCTRPGDPATTGTDAMAFRCHDMFLEVPLKRCVVLDVATSLKLKLSPHAYFSCLRLHSAWNAWNVVLWWCGGATVWCEMVWPGMM